MKLHLAGVESHLELVSELEPKFLLTSFFTYYKKKTINIPNADHHILDSGAYSIQKGKKVVWDEYVDAYINFIKSNSGISQYVELDIDCIVGLPLVEQWRNRFECEIGKPPIVVWHKSMGNDGWRDLCKSYPYVGIPCVNPDEKLDEIYWNRYITYAHECKCKVHGFGLSANEKIKKYKFDSCDSTAWASGGRYGARYRFTGDSIRLYRKDGYLEGCKPNVPLMNKTNMQEWIKFQNYMDCFKHEEYNHGFW